MNFKETPVIIVSDGWIKDRDMAAIKRYGMQAYSFAGCDGSADEVTAKTAEICSGCRGAKTVYCHIFAGPEFQRALGGQLREMANGTRWETLNHAGEQINASTLEGIYLKNAPTVILSEWKVRPKIKAMAKSQPYIRVYDSASNIKDVAGKINADMGSHTVCYCDIYGSGAFQEAARTEIAAPGSGTAWRITNRQGEFDEKSCKSIIQKRAAMTTSGGDRKPVSSTRQKTKAEALQEKLGVTKEEAAAVMFAAEEMQELKIYVPEGMDERQAQYDAFVKVMAMYVPDRKKAKELADKFLKQKSGHSSY